MSKESRKKLASLSFTEKVKVIGEAARSESCAGRSAQATGGEGGEEGSGVRPLTGSFAGLPDLRRLEQEIQAALRARPMIETCRSDQLSSELEGSDY